MLRKFRHSIIYFLAISAVLLSCEKEALVPDLHNNDNEKLSIPLELTKKVLLETMEAAWCQFSPDGDYRAALTKNDLGEDICEFAVYHFSDVMHLPESSWIMSKYLNSSFPCGQVDRMSPRPLNRAEWRSKARERMEVSAKCGLAIDASEIVDNTLELNVELAIGEEDLDEANAGYFLQIILIEKEIDEFTKDHWQANHYNIDKSSPFFERGDPMKDYIHPNTVVKVLNGHFGLAVHSSDLKSRTSKAFNFSVDLSDQDEDLRIIVMLYKNNVNNGVPYASETLNCQFVDIGEEQPFD